jgi:hypothetical protein
MNCVVLTLRVYVILIEFTVVIYITSPNIETSSIAVQSPQPTSPI